VKAFNTTFAGTLVPAQVAGQPRDVLVAADDPEAKQAVLALVEAAGLRGIDAVRCAVLASWRPWASYT